MTRDNAREIAVHMAYILSFGDRDAVTLLADMLTAERFAELSEESALYAQMPNRSQLHYIKALVQGAYDHAPELDGYIAQYAIGWNFARIPRVAAAILRTAMYEILYMPNIPNAAAINSAVNIAKHYESPSVVSFINGILGSFVRAEFPSTEPKPETE